MTKKEKFNNFIENAALKTGDVNIESMLKNNKEKYCDSFLANAAITFLFAL